MPLIHICVDYSKYSLECYKNKSLYYKWSEESYCTQVPDPVIQCNVNPAFGDKIPISCDKDTLIPGCTTINIKKTLQVRADKKIIIYAFNEILDIFFDDHDDLENTKDVLQGKRMHIYYPGEYKVELQKKIYNRLPSPYPSNCTYGHGVENFFAKRYSEEACLQSCQLRKMYLKCGAVFDRWSKFVTPNLKRERRNNQSIGYGQTAQCIKSVYEDANDTYLSCNCPRACHEIRTPMQISSRERHFYEIMFSYHPFEVEHVTEYPEYPLEQFIADFGGLVGLVAGMSVMSLLEIIICLIIGLFTKFYTR